MSAFPTSIKPNDVELISDQPTIITYSESGKSQSRILGGHLWRLKAKFPAMTRAQCAPLFAFAASMRGRLTSFTFIPESHATPQGIATGTPLVAGAHVAGAEALVVDGFTASQTGILKAGDLIKPNSHSKVYMVTADCDSIALGLTSIPITPPLVAAVANNDPLVVSNVPFTVNFDDDPLEWKTNRQSHSTYTIDLVESL